MSAKKKTHFFEVMILHLISFLSSIGHKPVLIHETTSDYIGPAKKNYWISRVLNSLFAIYTSIPRKTQIKQNIITRLQ